MVEITPPTWPELEPAAPRSSASRFQAATAGVSSLPRGRRPPGRLHCPPPSRAVRRCRPRPIEAGGQRPRRPANHRPPRSSLPATAPPQPPEKARTPPQPRGWLRARRRRAQAPRRGVRLRREARAPTRRPARPAPRLCHEPRRSVCRLAGATASAGAPEPPRPLGRRPSGLARAGAGRRPRQRGTTGYQQGRSEPASLSQSPSAPAAAAAAAATQDEHRECGALAPLHRDRQIEESLAGCSYISTSCCR